MSTEKRPHVVIIGGGFGGLACARALARAPVRITLFDKRNFHLFQPLLYEVATATLSPADITTSLRHALRKQRNVEVHLGEVTSINGAAQEIDVHGERVAYDYLVLATGLRTSYFGHDEWEALAPGLKTVEDAIEIRARFLNAFEHAEWEKDEETRARLLTFVVVGGGSTGMELAGSMAGMVRETLRGDFRNIDTSKAKIVLVEAAAQVLPGFPPDLAAKAKRQIERLGVEVRLGQRVTDVDARGILLGDERIEAANVFWAAGVTANPLGRSLGASLDASGRVHVQRDCSVPGQPAVFVIGDVAHFEESGRNITGVAPAAIQMAHFVARQIGRDMRGQARGEFRYFDKGTAATIGRAAAVARSGRLRISGFPAWLIWVLLHIVYLTTFRNRLAVTAQWLVAWFAGKKGVRLITEHWQPAHGSEGGVTCDEATAQRPDPQREQRRLYGRHRTALQPRGSDGDGGATHNGTHAGRG